MVEPPVLEIEALHKQYPGAPEAALKGVSLRVQRGEFFGLLGPNGAGKTTLINIVCGLLAPTSGEVQLQGCNTSDGTRRLGLVPQDLALYPTLTARENLFFFGRMQGLGRELGTRADAWLERVGLMPCARRRVATFSGGMKRRLNLIVGLLHEPALLVLDEPTVGIDPQSRLLIHENLLRLNTEGVTILYTTHYLQEAETLCSRLAVMDCGRVIAEGAPTALVKDHSGCSNLEDVFIKLTGRQLRDD
ncbi:MAG: ABC transporter ATP-binding protein [Sedimentisphaerales bacterium]|nr:ABC transporter ATP-binding protein [Sedimentisphaerales bacterium]